MDTSWRDINTLYHIYPRSFQDSNGDGIGDINGIISRLDYLSQVLNIDAIWLSPFFTSPMRDFGYDVADYKQVDPDYGTLSDFRKLLTEAHRRNIKVMIDFVPCHTSDQHVWFQESKLSTDNPKRDYYTWREPGPDGKEPNNWLSQSGGSSWSYDKTTEQYFLHSFLESQPDLNWDNPLVRKEMMDIVRWWFELGVDGIRVDAIWGISKDPELADDPINPEFNGDQANSYGQFIHSRCKYGPNFEKYLKELSDVCHEFSNRQMIFEFYPDDKLGDFYDQYRQVSDVNPTVASTFFMELIRSSWHADMIGAGIDKYVNESSKRAIPVFCLGNHDQRRVVSRIGETKARAMALLQMTLPGLAVIYYGEEIGMTDGILKPSQVRDTFSPLNSTDTTRDLERTPMQWDESKYAGFSQTKPWLPVNKNSVNINAVAELSKSKSMLSLYRRLINMRKSYDVFPHGSLERMNTTSGYVLGFIRKLEGHEAYVLINFADQEKTETLPSPSQCLMSSDCSTTSDSRPDETSIRLRPFEAAVYIAA